ncbi:hypothetical protein [Hoeflea sp.]|uniref:hypothetical protein n=1 Tax=Hoeflea sp. TaxID=1940281 RepID=UPI003749CB3D
MSVQHSPKLLISASLLVAGLSCLAAPAMALDADDFATKLAAIVSQGGASLTFNEITGDGGTVVLKSTRFEAEAPSGRGQFDIGDVVFKGIEESGDGSYFVNLVEFEDVNVISDGNSFSVADIEINGLLVPADLETIPLPGMIPAQSFSTGNISIEENGGQIFGMSGIVAENNYSDDFSSQHMEMNGSGLTIDVSRVKDPKARDAFASMGYQTLTGAFKMAVDWEAEGGKLDVSEYSFTLDDVGRLAMSMQIAGYTTEVIKGMQQAQELAAANPDPQAGQQAMGFAMLGLVQQLNFVDASIRFEDQSLTEKALAYAGKQQGISGEQMAQAIKGMLPLMLGQLRIPALQQQISAAANIYLDNPGSITVSAKPGEPVSLPVIMGAGMGDPKALVDLLNVDVTANQPADQ